MPDGLQKETDRRVMMLSIKAGGVAPKPDGRDTVIPYDLRGIGSRRQAADWAYCIGYERTIRVHRLISLGTFEE